MLRNRILCVLLALALALAVVPATGCGAKKLSLTIDMFTKGKPYLFSPSSMTNYYLDTDGSLYGYGLGEYNDFATDDDFKASNTMRLILKDVIDVHSCVAVTAEGVFYKWAKKSNLSGYSATPQKVAESCAACDYRGYLTRDGEFYFDFGSEQEPDFRQVDSHVVKIAADSYATWLKEDGTLWTFDK